jgi:cytochrome P450
MMTTMKIPPGPKGLPFVGNLWQVIRDPLHFPFRMAREYGDVVRARVGNLVFYLLVHPDHIEYVLRNNYRNFIKDRGTRLLTHFLGEGLLTSEGELWRRQRRLSQPAFQVDQIAKYSEVMVAYTGRMLHHWRPGQTRDVHADMMKLTLEIVAQTLFSASVEGRAEQVGESLEIAMEYFASPKIWFSWLQKLPLPGNRRFWRAVKQLDSIIYETIARRRAGESQGNDLLARLLAARDEDGGRMTDVQVHDEIVTLFLAGHETTALALSYSLYLLAQHPEAEARLASELAEVLRDQSPSWIHVPRLRYTEWVVKETMRLFPPAPSIGREALADCEIGGYFVPKGTQIALMQWVVHRDPRWFEDPKSFKPERWDNDLAKRLPRCAYFPFGDGPRICIGNQFAMVEAVLVLATILQRYRFSLAPGFKLELLPSVTLRPKSGVEMVVQERQPAWNGQSSKATETRTAV